MHIIFLTHEYPKKGLNGGGVGSFVQFLSKELVKNNIQVSVIGVNNLYINEKEEDCGVKIYRIEKSKWKVGRFYQNAKRILKKINELDKLNKVDIIEGSELSFAFFPKKTTYKKLIRLHGGHHFFAIELGKKPTFWRGYQEKKSFDKAEAYIAVSNYVGEKTQQYLKYNFHYVTIYNSVDITKFKEPSNSLVKKNSLLFIGTVCEKKGVRQLVQAMPIVKEQIPDVTLNIVGRDWKFPNGKSYIDYLKTFIPNAMEDSINVIGPVPHSEIPSYIEKASVCVYPSHMEAMPIAWLEGLLMEKATVVGDIGPAKEAVIDKVTALVANPYSPKDIAEKIIFLIENPEMANLIRIAARKDILKRFNPNEVSQKNIKFYQTLISNK